jgi:hypothetical protein
MLMGISSAVKLLSEARDTTNQGGSKMKPSDFKSNPDSSVFQNSETETIAGNIMTIMARNGDQWERPTWLTYKAIRIEDGNFSMRERPLFDKVWPYLKSADTAASFSPVWAKCKEKAK